MLFKFIHKIFRRLVFCGLLNIATANSNTIRDPFCYGDDITCVAIGKTCSLCFALLEIEGQIYKVKIGEKIFDYTVNDITEDLISLSSSENGDFILKLTN